MFEFKYKITCADMEKVNKNIMWTYFIPYILVAIAGLAAGITATVTKPSVTIMVLGIILIVLGALLSVCAILLAILPKAFVTSAILPDDELERNVKLDDGGITVSTENQSDITFGYGEVTNVKTKKFGLLLYLGKDKVLPIFGDDKLLADAAASVCSIKSKKNEEAPAPAEKEKAENNEEAPAPENATDTETAPTDEPTPAAPTDENA